MLPNLISFIPNCTSNLQRNSAPVPGQPELSLSMARANSTMDMQQPARQPLLAKINQIGLQVQNLWHEHGLHPATTAAPATPTDAQATPPPNQDRAKRMARITAAEQFFHQLPWQPLSMHGDIAQASAQASKSKAPATRMEITFNAPAGSVMPFMMRHVQEYQNWLPVIREMKIIEKPSEFERVLEIETYGKFGFGKRHAFALATFDAQGDETRILLEHLPDHKRGQHSSKSPEMKHFKSLMSFSPEGSDDKSTKFTYYNHADPNIRRAPARLILSETLENNRSFVELCTTKLVDSQLP